MAPHVQLRRLTRRDDCTTSGRTLAGSAGRAVQPPLDGVFAFLPFRAAAAGAWWQWTATRELDTRQRRAGPQLQPSSAIPAAWSGERWHGHPVADGIHE